jgi:hypothetical protein
MFNASIFSVLSGVVLFANLVAVPKIINFTVQASAPGERSVLLASVLMNSIFLSVVAVAVGCYMAPRVGLSSYFLEALVHLDAPHIVLLHLLGPASISGVLVVLGMLAIQSVLVRHCFALPDDLPIPVSTRILRESVVEQIIYRWGLIPLIIWMLTAEIGVNGGVAVRVAIIVSALGSAMSHIHDLSRRNFYPLNRSVTLNFCADFWGAIICGWLYVHYGITAAILCHAFAVLIAQPLFDVIRFVFPEDARF